MLHIAFSWHYCKIKTKITLFSNALIQLKNIHIKAVYFDHKLKVPMSSITEYFYPKY